MITGRRTFLGMAALAVMLVNCSKAATMDSHAATYDVAALVARLDAARDTVRDMPDEAARGYPVPVLAHDRIYLAVPYFLRRGHPPKPPELTAPRWVGYIDISTGEDISWRNLDNDTGTALGVHKIDPPLDREGFRAAESEMYASMSVLLPLAKNPDSPVPADLRAAAETFARRWRQLAHRPLAAHYRALNPQWFAKLGL